MTIEELIKELKEYSPDDKVYISSDSEGNNIKTIYQVAVTEDGKFLPSKEEVAGAEFLGGRWLKWERTKDFITIYPTDTVVNN